MKGQIDKAKRDMLFKWAGLPFAILCVMLAGAAYNLFAYFQLIGAIQGYGAGTMV